MKTQVNNYLAIGLCALLSMVLPALWYMLFSDPWMSGNGLALDDIENGHSPFPYIIAGIGSLVGAYILSWLNISLGANTFIKGLGVGLLMGITFCFLPMATQNAFSFKPNILTFIDGGVNLVNWMMVGGILGAWRKYQTNLKSL